MAYSLAISISLGASQTGLTLNGQLVDTVGANVGSAITSGFVEIGSGNYLLASSIPDAHRGGLKIYKQGQTDILAFLAVNPEEAEKLVNLDDLRVRG